MAIPDYQSIMLPLLQFAADEKEHSLRQAIESLSAEFGLTEEEKKELLPSGQQPTFENRVAWARTYLVKAALLEAPRRGFFRITPRGRDVLSQRPSAITPKFLEQFPEFLDFRTKRHESKEETQLSENRSLQTPGELLESAYQKLREDLAAELLKTVKECSPAFFERLVIDVLVKMGYGGSRKEAGKAIGRSGDEGIDGIINEDRLGLDVIYIQAKRWKDQIGRPEIQKFVGALQGHRANKGIFITTSSFTREAQDYVTKINSKIVLIDGEHLSQLMIDHNVGVTPVMSYETKKIDSDYFFEE
ncbi:restriction endonuclease [Candidatus Nitrospira inopinata]|jgi:restriction system protein|uniref:Mrr restriction system protein n=1 Tax=Candidatus Nitrospira inopinata TaxID=1715989 RepID=A0A0S4KQW5_9BACT|nr:restriction endonuclease [Candidatus Nitrospira inopinata]CUQ66759.1 Mrr restriction system protein [Candidatus Nitrospira inopinata]